MFLSPFVQSNMSSKGPGKCFRNTWKWMSVIFSHFLLPICTNCHSKRSTCHSDQNNKRHPKTNILVISINLETSHCFYNILLPKTKVFSVTVPVYLFQNLCGNTCSYKYEYFLRKFLAPLWYMR